MRACDRMGLLMEQLLTLARLEQAPSPQLTVPCDLAADRAQRRLPSWPRQRWQNGVEISLEATGNTTVTGQAALLDMLIRNLVANAIQHGRYRCTGRHRWPAGQRHTDGERLPVPACRRQISHNWEKGSSAARQPDRAAASGCRSSGVSPTCIRQNSAFGAEIPAWASSPARPSRPALPASPATADIRRYPPGCAGAWRSPCRSGRGSCRSRDPPSTSRR